MPTVELSHVFLIILFMCLLVFLAIASDYAWHARREHLIQQIRKKLGLTYPLRNHMLAHYIKGMMDGADGAHSDKVFGLKIGMQNVVLGDYIHILHQGQKEQLIRHSVIVVSLERGEAVPLFSLHGSEFFDSSFGEIGWLSVNGVNGRSLGNQLSVLAPKKHHETILLFFNSRAPLIRFCHRYHRYHLICDGRRILFYKPHRVIDLTVDAYAKQVALAEELVDCFDLGLANLSQDDDYEPVIKSLKKG